jgi:abequosyltransferase
MKVSFCIPTKNFGPYIQQCLQSIFDQSLDQNDFEIVILDSGSTDNTAQIISNFQEKYSNINYIYEEKAEGIDKAIIKVVSHAKAPYCWLLSADDAFSAGALAKILSIVQLDYDVILCNRFWCNKELDILKTEHWRNNVIKDEFLSFSNSTDIKHYLDTSRSLGALFSFMSCIGFKKSVWDSLDLDISYIGTNYAHVPRLLEIGKSAKGLAYLADPLVLCRSGNDSFRSDGLLGRMLIDIRAYRRFALELFPDNSLIQNGFYRVLRIEHKYLRWIKAFLLSSSSSHKEEALSLLKDVGYHHLFCKILTILARLQFFQEVQE